jgi:PleD family two-component response regulator
MKASIQAYGARIGIPVDLSIGVSSIGPGADAVRVIELADQRMYEQKAAHHEHEPAPEKTWPFRGTSTPSG